MLQWGIEVKFQDKTIVIPGYLYCFNYVLSLPVTVASADRSFSKLKYIKNYLRNSMAQERLKGLALYWTLKQKQHVLK